MSEYRILRRRGTKLEFLRHEGHSHFWSANVADAMVYTKLDVARDLCVQKTGTEVQTVDGQTAFITPLS